MSCKSVNISIYYIAYMTMKSLKDANIDCENSLHFIFNTADEYIIEESNEDKYLIFRSTNQSKKVL